MIFLSQGAAAERGFVLTWRQEWAVNKACYALYRAQWLYKAVAALMRVPALPADFDRLISSGCLIHVTLYRSYYCTRYILLVYSLISLPALSWTVARSNCWDCNCTLHARIMCRVQIYAVGLSACADCPSCSVSACTYYYNLAAT